MRAAVLLLLGVASVGCGATGVGTVGAVLGRDNETHDVFVREVSRGRAAAQAGVVAGDQVMMIDGLFVGDLSLKEIGTHLRGTSGSSVMLTLLRGTQVHRVRVVRGGGGGFLGSKPKEERLAE